MTEARFAEISASMQRQGFPTPDLITGNYDLVAIDAWLDRRAGLTKSREITATNAADGFEERLARIG